MWVRKDIAEQIWDLNVTPMVSPASVQEELIRARTIDLPATSNYTGQYGSLPLLTPRAVAVGPDGSRVIADTGNHRIVVLDANGSFLREFGSHCRLAEGEAGGCVDPDGAGPLILGDGQFYEPWGVTVDADGNIYVADTWNGRIQVFSPEGEFLRKWGNFNTTNGELGDAFALFGPRGVEIDQAGNLLVADTGNKRILMFTPTGELLQQVGGGGVALGRFEEPTDVGVDPRDGSIYVADAWNRRIQKLDGTLQPLAEWPVESWGSEHLYHKPYVTVAGNGDVYVSDPANFRVLVYNDAGGLKSAFGSFGPELNRFALPNGVAWDGLANALLVADSDNQRVLGFPALP
jgi:DNA-binding beta-propeller fold protein YncE